MTLKLSVHKNSYGYYCALGEYEDAKYLCKDGKFHNSTFNNETGEWHGYFESIEEIEELIIMCDNNNHKFIAKYIRDTTGLDVKVFGKFLGVVFEFIKGDKIIYECDGIYTALAFTKGYILGKNVKSRNN